MSDTKQWIVTGVMALVVASVSPVVAQIPDHLACYKVKDPLTKGTYQADVDGLVPTPGCTIKVPGQLFCTQTTKTNVTPEPPGGGSAGPAGRFLCYKLKCPKAVAPTVAWRDQFGDRNISATKPKIICAPEILPVTTTSTSSTTTTTTSSTTSTTACASPNSACGSSGQGICMYNCPTDVFVCVENGFGPQCSSDADCALTGRPICVGGEPFCGDFTQHPTGCAVAVP